MKVALKGKWNPSVVMFNSTGYSSKQAKALERYAADIGEACTEMISMMAYMKKKLKKARPTAR